VNQPEELFSESESEFAQQLTRAMRPVAPPEGFAGRTMARLQPAAPVRAKVVTMVPRPRLWAGGALAATLVIAAVLTQQTHAHRQRRQAELAQQQFEAGIRITDQTLDHVRLQLQQAGLQIGN
jgi:hypothetical protein